MSVRRARTKDGKTRWIVRYYEAGRAGAYRQRTFDRRHDADFFAASIRRGRQLGQLASELVGSEQTVKEFIDEWWDKYAVTRLAPGTLASYVYVLDRWITPYLGRLKLRDLSREAVDEFYTGLVAAGAGVPTVNRALGILQGILQRAVEWRRIAANPVAGVPRLAHVRDVAIDARTPEEVEAIRSKLGRRDTALVSVLAYEGLRPGEAFALEWRDVLDRSGLPRKRLRVERALSNQALSTTKSKRAREPELFGPVATELAELYLFQGRPQVRALVFPDTAGGHLRRHNWRQRVWIPALAAAGVSYFRPYDLRHTCATLLIHDGRSVNEVAQQLGHADPGFTARTYAHVFTDASQRRRVPIAEAIVAGRWTQDRLSFDG